MPIVARMPESNPPRRRRRLKSLRILPSLFTLANLLCGFAAIHFSLRAMSLLGAGMDAEAGVPTSNARLLNMMFPSILSFAAGLVILGNFMDMLDGLVARVTRSTTDFGGQLDSMADVVNCGVAPATLMIAFMMQQFKGDEIAPSPLSATVFGRVAWACAVVYVAFTAVRLARYNVEHAQADFDYRTFRGLPSPGAAVMMCAVILFHDQIGQTWRPYLVYAMPGIALATGCLMVSRLPYLRLQGYLRGRKPFKQLVVFVLVFAVFWSYKAPTLFALVLCYVLSGPVSHIAKLVRDRLTNRQTKRQKTDGNGCDTAVRSEPGDRRRRAGSGTQSA